MRFGTYYFLQTPPGTSEAAVIHREFAQILLSEELGYDTVWLTEHHFKGDAPLPAVEKRLLGVCL